MINRKEIYWQQLVEALAQGVLIIDKKGVIHYANEQAACLFGLALDKLKGTYFTQPLDTQETQEIEIFKQNGEIRIAQMVVRPGAWQGQFAWIVSLLDISELKKKDKLLTITSKSVNAASEGIIITNEKGTIVQANKAFLKLTGFNESEVIGKNPNFLHSGKQTREFYENLWSILLRQGYWSGELVNKVKNNKLISILLTISAVKDENGDVSNYIGFLHDLTTLKAQEKQLERAKYYDVVTALPNRFFLTQNLEQYIRTSHHKHKNLIILSIRIFGSHKDSVYTEDQQTRDKIILQVVERIRRNTHKIQFLARIGYNEFVIVYFTHQNLTSFSLVAKEIIKVLSKPYKVNEKSYKIYCVIGLAAYKKYSAFSAEELLHQAEIARHKARLSGVNTFDFFDPQVEIETIEFNKYIKSIQHAIQSNELKLYYQPKVNLKTGKVIGIEALLRWQHPKRGLLAASEFLFQIDYHPISLELGHWVLHQALQQAEALVAQHLEIPISINISSYQLQDKDFVKKIDEALTRYPTVPSKLLMLEILETEALADLQLVSQIIKDCKKRGIHFSLDDFGTGYSSLTYLKDLDIAEVKLDRGFIRNILTNAQDLAILKPTIDLCRVMGHELVAEGVETILHGKLLMHLGCSQVQGFAISKAMSSEALIPWLKSWKLSPKWNKNKIPSELIIKFMAIAIKHYMQFQKIEQYLKNNQVSLPDLTLKNCSVEKWLNKYKSNFDSDVFKKLTTYHKKQHLLAKKIITLADNNNYEQAYKQLKTFGKIRDLILHNLILAIFIPD
ncbi:EAL domain-containing protein [Legionella gresilensis]|uniref:EAL domain-containing protein n=1 Tax=Legionella gresilensis TaxID=91823 RepID=UPI00104128AD|nr:EAL domain-containing protein [Legionella gresilensis]